MRAVLPDLAHDVGLGVDRADLLAPGAPEVVGSDLVGHIEAPAVDALLGPVLGDLEQVLLDFLVLGGLELGQGAEAPPGVVVGLGVVHHRVVPDGVVVPVLGGLAVLLGVLEPDVVVAGVVEHAVDDHLDAVLVKLADQALELGVGAEARIDLHVVGRVVLVVRAGLEERVEVDRVDAHRLQVGDLLAHAGEVTAHEVVEVGLGVPGHGALGVVGLVAVGEALGEDLVEDRVFDPLGGEALGLGLRGAEGLAVAGRADGRAGQATAGQQQRADQAGGQQGAKLHHDVSTPSLDSIRGPGGCAG
ncbi:hypothetical protein D3C72_1313260 [compost metagenome]